MDRENPTINWNNIRCHNGSQNSGFEELVCQLARSQNFSDGRFIRLGTPDGGVEAYWIFPDGSEYGWQAKYFNLLGNSQWQQIRASYEASLQSHPNLKRYYICVPLDRPDARIPRKKSAMQRWQELEAVAKASGVELIYWGNSELINLLLQDQNHGLRYYWFNEKTLDQDWFAKHVEQSIKNLGPRYTPEINVDLKISQQFDLLQRNQRSYKWHCENYVLLTRKIQKSIQYLPLLNQFPELKELEQLLAELKALFYVSVGESINTANLNKKIKQIRILTERNINKFDEYKKSGVPNAALNDEQIKFYLDSLYDINYSLREFQETITPQYLSLFNNGAALLCGDAGSGKSHLLASVAEQCIKDKTPCVLLLGQHFSTSCSPWEQILESQLRLKCDEQSFLQMLNDIGINHNQRILFMIDAINEGAGIRFWPNYLAGFISDFKKYPYIALVISVRSSYLEYFRESISDTLCIIEHTGFSDDELFNAQEIFFEYYGLRQSNVPLLNPEFNNPLFLKLFCSGIQKSNCKTIPKGIRGLRKTFDLFLDNAAKSIYSRNQQISVSLRIIPEIIRSIISVFLENKMHFVNYNRAAQIVASVASKYGICLGTEILEELISEGILMKDIIWMRNEDNHEEILRFAYERLENLETAKQLLGLIKKENLEQEFSADGNLFFHAQDPGMLEMFSIIIPEIYKCELYNILPEQKIDHRVAQAFLQSLLWRSPDTIDYKSSENFIYKHVLENQYTYNQFIETLYAIAAEEGHPFNADALHSWLCKYNMAVRDSFWTTAISKSYYSDTRMSRFIDWCKKYGHRMIDGEESTLLTATALCWLFASTNNSLRNNATFSLIKLLINHLATAIKLLQKFACIDDPYIHERIWAAIYGAVVNSTTLPELSSLSQWIVDNFFNVKEVYPNVLVRDYARNIVEYACFAGCFHLDDPSIITPPYNSSFPDKLPDDDYVKQFDLPYNTPGLPENYQAQRAIIHSMITEYGRGMGGYGDFGRYVFQGRLRMWDRFESQSLSNYAISLIFDKYGYSIDLHGSFDVNEPGYDRSRKYIERIGKKYQWISLYEVAARLSDNFPILLDEYRFSTKKHAAFSGPWESYFRDIDPTYSWDDLPVFPLDNINFHYDKWNENFSDWIRNASDMPKFSAILKYDDLDQQSWIVLKENISWKNNFFREHDDITQSLVYLIGSAFVKKSDLSVLKQLSSLSGSGREFFDTSENSCIYFREYFWSPSYKYFNNSRYFQTESWVPAFEFQRGNISSPKVMFTTSLYFWESEFIDSASHSIPCKKLADFFKLSPGNKAGEWISQSGEIVCKELFIEDSKKRLFLINKEKLFAFLSANELVLAWSCYGEKLSYHSHYESVARPLELAGYYFLCSGKITGKCHRIKHEET